MKKTVFLLALLMFLKPILPVVEYVVNYEYISKVLCVNKDKPMLHCNGKCQLMKELAKASENEKPISDKKIVAQEFEVLFFENIKLFEAKPRFYFITTQINDSYSNFYSHLNSCSVFHPPTCIS
jgi:hypothetical protein